MNLSISEKDCKKSQIIEVITFEQPFNDIIMSQKYNNHH